MRRDDTERDDGGSSLLAHGEMMNQQLESLESVVNEIGACLRVQECRIASLKDDIIKELSALKATVTALRSQGVTILLCHISDPIFEVHDAFSFIQNAYLMFFVESSAVPKGYHPRSDRIHQDRSTDK